MVAALPGTVWSRQRGASSSHPRCGRHYVKPSEARQIKSKAAQRLRAKAARARRDCERSHSTFANLIIQRPVATRLATSTGQAMPKKPNYDYEKRQKEIARKQKKEEKRARKREDAQLPGPSSDAASELPATPATK